MLEALLGALLLGDPALVLVLPEDREASAWTLLEEQSSEAALALATAPLDGAAPGPLYASVGALLPQGSGLRPAARVILPMQDVEAGWAALQAALEAQGWGQVSSCGEGCLSRVRRAGARAPEPVVAQRLEGHLALSFPIGSAPVPADAPASWRPPESPRRTPAVQALMRPDTRAAALLRVEAVQPWATLSLAWERDEVARFLGGAGALDWWWIGSEPLGEVAWMLTPAIAEFEDLIVREVDEHWEIVGTLTSVGLSLRREVEPARMPTWRGSETSAHVRVVADLSEPLKGAVPPWIDPWTPADERVQARARCGPPCALMAAAYPWAALRLPFEGGPERYQRLPSGTITGGAFHLALEDGEGVVSTTLLFPEPRLARSYAEGAEERLGEAQSVERWRRRYVLVSEGDNATQQGRLERVAPGLEVRTPAPPGGDLLAALLDMRVKGPWPARLGDLDFRHEDGTLFGAPPGVSAPPLEPVASRPHDALLADLEAQRCVNQLRRGEVSAALAALEGQAPEPLDAGVRSCLGAAGQHPVVRLLAADRFLDSGLAQVVSGGMVEGRARLVEACGLGQGYACHLLGQLPQEAAALLDGAPGPSWPFGAWLVIEGDEARLSGGARCAASDAACVTDRLGLRDRYDTLKLLIDPAADLGALQPTFAALRPRNPQLSWLRPDGEGESTWQEIELRDRNPGPYNQNLTVQVTPTALRVEGRAVDSLEALAAEARSGPGEPGRWITLHLSLEEGVTAARLAELLEPIEGAEQLRVAWRTE